MTFKFLEHTGDLKISVEGKDLEFAFSECARALKEAIAEKTKIKNNIAKKIIIRGKDRENLLYSFLEEFLFLLDAQDFILNSVNGLRIIKSKKGFQLEFNVVGDRASNYKISNDVKAITFSEMSIKETKKGVKIIFVLDV